MILNRFVFLISLSATLLNSFILKAFWWRLYGFLYIVLWHMKIVTVLLPFQFGFLYFFFLSDCHGSPPNSMLNWSGKSGHPYLVPEFRGKSFSFHCSDDVSCGLAINSLYNVEICSLCTYFDENFFHEWMLNFVKVFFGRYYDYHVIFILFLCGVSHWLVDIESSLHSWSKSHWIVVYDPFYKFLNLVC